MLIRTDSGAPAPLANAHKDGTDSDVCPVHGGDEVEPVHRIGYGKSPGGVEHLDGLVYTSDVRAGGCGDSWGRKTRTGAEHDQTHSAESGAVTLTRGATRTFSMPSDAFRDNYDRAFKKGAYAEADRH